MPASSSPAFSGAPASTASRPENAIESIIWQGSGASRTRQNISCPCQKIICDETIETIGEITRKNSAVTTITVEFAPSPQAELVRPPSRPKTRTGCPPSGSLYVWRVSESLHTSAPHSRPKSRIPHAFLGMPLTCHQITAQMVPAVWRTVLQAPRLVERI